MIRVTKALSGPSLALLSTHQAVTDAHQDRGQEHPEELVPVEEREAPQPGLVLGVGRDQERYDDRDRQQDAGDPVRGSDRGQSGHCKPPRDTAGATEHATVRSHKGLDLQGGPWITKRHGSFGGSCCPCCSSWSLPCRCIRSCSGWTRSRRSPSWSRSVRKAWSWSCCWPYSCWYGGDGGSRLRW